MPYILTQAGDPTERERLALLQKYYDRKTISKLIDFGVASGWHCYDIGAGAGSIAQWLAERVAPDGYVVALDLDLTLLEPLASETLIVRRHDIRFDDLPESVDLINARLLLEHLPDHSSVLRRMIRALRPGGWILLTDTDFRTVRLKEPDAAFDRIASAFADATYAAGWNMQLGPQFAPMLEDSGLINVGAESWETYGRKDDHTALLAMTYRRLREALLAQGAHQNDVDRFQKSIEDGDVGIFSPTSWMAWGRRSLT